MMETKKMTGATIVMESLLAEGVDTIFGYPGGAIMPVYDALYDYDTVRHILARHEQGAIHAAQGYARTSTKTGVVFSTSGPGATNLVTGLADAMMDSTPLVCITGQVASPFLGTDAFQETDVIGLSMPVTKWSCQVVKADDIAAAIAKAFYVASRGRPGPVLIDITKDAQFQKTDFQYEKCHYIRSYSPRPALSLSALQRAANLINKAQKPLLLAGQGVILSQAESELKSFVEKTGIPVASTLLGLGGLPNTHELYTGLLGMHGNYAPNIKTNACDVLIAVGMRFDDRVTGDVSRYAKQAEIIHIDIDAAELHKIIHADVPIHADAKEALQALCELSEPREHRAWLAEFHGAQKIEQRSAKDNKSSDKQLITMGRVVDLLSEQTAGKAVVTTDVGQHQMMVARYYQYRSSKNNVTSGGLGTMGFALPAAIGAKLGAPDKMSIAVIGDGGFQMTLQELGVLMETRLEVKIVILNNNFLGMVRQWQQLFFDKRYAFTEMCSPDYVALAKAYQIEGARIEERSGLENAIKKMLSHNGSYLLEVMVAKEENVFPMIPSGASVSEIRLT